MFDSVKDWINVPFVLKPKIGNSALGDSLYSDAIDLLCYPEPKVQLVRNKSGVEVVTDTTLYLFGTTEINEGDQVNLNGRVSEVRALSEYYRDGSVDIKVAYV